MIIDDVLLKCGLIDEASLERARTIQGRDHCSLGRAIAELGLNSEETVATAVARGLHLEYVKPGTLLPAKDIVGTLSSTFCRKHLVLPLTSADRGLRLAMVNPLDYSTIQNIEFRTGKSVKVVVSSECALLSNFAALEAAVLEEQKVYDMLQVTNPAGEVESLPQPEHDLVNPTMLARDAKTPPIVRLVNLVLSEGVSAGASDIHIEAQEDHVQVRYRVDGLLRDAMKIPRHLKDSIISRLKIISGLDISERRKPQDGRTRLRYEGRRIDMRVSTLPTQFGEKVVIRLLDNSRGPRRLEDLDLSAENFKMLHSLLLRTQGMILATGPTGSGKTSTLYSALAHIKSTTNNIITVEDPIEIQLAGINQVQVNPRAGVTFAVGLRSILRQDPNVILVGEIRDSETAGIACEAAQTGHLLLSTVHTTDAAGTITRLLNLNVEAFLIAASLIGVIAQRLVRRSCESCKVEVKPNAELFQKSGASVLVTGNHVWLAGKGCDLCGGTGFAGRVAVHEILLITEEIRELISTRAPEHAIRKAARAQGMKTMLEDGAAKAAAGITTLEEVVRVFATSEASPSPPAPVAMPVVPVAMPVVMPAALQVALPPASGPNGPKRRVLVVEDSSTVSTVLRYFLELEGFDVTLAEDGNAGLAMATSAPPDLIITDVNMPGLDGISMLRALRADASTQNIPVLMLTAEASLEVETQGLESGADDYLVKPVEPRRLAARAKAAMTRGRRR